MKRALKPTDTHPGDEVRIVAPSLSLAIIADDQLEIAAKRLTAHGLRVTFGDHARERDLFNSSSVASRIADLHAAFADPDVKGILTIIGGANANQLLDKLDYDLIAANPKIFCGYSDITALQNAILAKTGLVTYSGPHFSTYGMLKGNDYTDAYFCRCVMAEGAYSIEPSPEWSDDAWFRDQENRTFIPSTGWQIIQFGQATGTAIGGNLCTFNLLQGTHQSGWGGVRGIVFGRFQKQTEVTVELLRQVVMRKPALAGLPIAADLDFGHTSPFDEVTGLDGFLQVSTGAGCKELWTGDEIVKLNSVGWDDEAPCWRFFLCQAITLSH